MRKFGLVMAGAALLALPLGVLAQDKPKNPHSLRVAKESNSQPAPAPAPVIVQDYEPRPAIWRLADEDTTIYLFGTYHILPPGLVWRNPQFDAIVQEADELIVESSNADLSEDELTQELIPLLSPGSQRTPTSQRLSPEAAEKWRKLADLSGLPFEAFDRMPPIMAVFALGIGFAYEAGSTSDVGVETILEAEFAEAGKPIGSIEEPLPVFRNVLAIDEEVLIAQLEKDFAEWDGESLETMFVGTEEETDDSLFASEHAWARGDEPSEEMFGDSPFEQAMQKVLLTDRNRAWALWLDERLDAPGTVLVAVGSGHFQGSDSVQIMLAERGLTAVRIN
ncbi:MAG: TraB/GumN family protein [Erythrobacter sp.]|nr:TraB/GumN family protein [Erythrobacter sp.]NCQ64575.1 TraB/GumN family protein [Alphaproteobacteria bacterium]